MPSAATLMDLEIIILREVRERKISYQLYVESKKKMIQMNLFTKQTHRLWKQIYDSQSVIN